MSSVFLGSVVVPLYYLFILISLNSIIWFISFCRRFCLFCLFGSFTFVCPLYSFFIFFIFFTFSRFQFVLCKLSLLCWSVESLFLCETVLPPFLLVLLSNLLGVARDELSAFFRDVASHYPFTFPFSRSLSFFFDFSCIPSCLVMLITFSSTKLLFMAFQSDCD